MVEYPGIWYFYLMSQHRFHNVKKKKKSGAKMLSFRQENKTVQFCTEGKKKTTFECHFHSFFSVG